MDRDMFVERNEQVKFKTESGMKEPKMGWSRPVKELTVIACLVDRGE